MKKKICCIFNLAATYRAAIYQLMDKELDCDFYLGDRVASPIKKMDYTSLKGYRKTLKRIHLFSHFYWQKGAVACIFKPYSQYILTGEPSYVSNWVIQLFAKLLGKEVYLWSHGFNGSQGRRYEQASKLSFKLATKGFLYGNFARNYMIKAGVKANKLICIYNSLDYNIQKPLRTNYPSAIYQTHFHSDAPVLIFLGRIQKVKKLDLLIKAIHLLKKKGKIINLVLVGKTTDVEDLEQLVDTLELNKQVWFYGPSFDETKNSELFCNADLCVSPGNIGLTAMHALSYGCPIITNHNFCTQMPEFEAITEEKTGLFFEENNLKDLTLKIEQWLDYAKDKRETIRKDCYKVIDEHYNPSYQLNVLKKTLAKSH